MQSIIRFVIKIYQLLIRPILPASCKFYPSCSEYALEAFKTQGILRGFYLTAFRLLRCNPWSMGGYDPVLLNEKEKLNGN